MLNASCDEPCPHVERQSVDTYVGSQKIIPIAPHPQLSDLNRAYISVGFLLSYLSFTSLHYVKELSDR